MCDYKYIEPTWDIDNRPIFEIEGNLYKGPRLIPEVRWPNGSFEQKRAKSTLNNLCWHAWQHSKGLPTSYHGVDQNGFHRIT